MSTIGFMAKKPAQPKKDRHKPSKQYRVKKQLARLLDRLAERRASSGPEEVNRAVRELLEREGLWPQEE